MHLWSRGLGLETPRSGHLRKPMEMADMRNNIWEMRPVIQTEISRFGKVMEMMRSGCLRLVGEADELDEEAGTGIDEGYTH